MSKHNKGPHGDPDKGPPMLEGAHHFNKGYVSDEKHFSPDSDMHSQERGNKYMKMQNEIVHRDTRKLKANKFSKIA